MGKDVVKKREWVGRVLSNKMDKTVVVAVERSVAHPIYKKVCRRITKLKARDSGKIRTGWTRPSNR
jgi:small subunit ribosomal protein S17